MKWYDEVGELIMKQKITEYNIQVSDDTDEYDETGEVNEPCSPIWDGGTVQHSFYGDDPTTPDPNEISQD